MLRYGCSASTKLPINGQELVLQLKDALRHLEQTL